MVRIVVGKGGTNGVLVVNVVAQAGDQCVAAGTGLARRKHGKRVARITVAIEIDPVEVGAAAEEAADAVDRRTVRGGRAIRAGGRADQRRVDVKAEFARS